MNDEAKNTPTHSVTRRLAALAGLGFGQRSHSPATVAVTLGAPATNAEALDLSDPEQRNLGDYELLEEIGHGGMGIVYRARQNSLGREVAVKILAAGPWASASFTERFRQEAQSAARMQHPNIVAIHEIGEVDGISFFSMQYVRGNNLHRCLGAGLGPGTHVEIARLVKTLADAVHYAHQLNVLHLDLKPANVLIADDDGRPFIADFGLARPLDHAMAAETDEISGTPSYMAPEQAEFRSHALSRATDIYGLGAILYELIGKRPPHLGPTPAETMRLVIGGELTAPRTIDKNIPVDLEAICLKCLARNPEERYVSAQILSDDLARFIDGNPISIRRQTALDRLAKWYRHKQFTRWTLARGLALTFAAFIAVGYSDSTLRRIEWFSTDIGKAVVRSAPSDRMNQDLIGTARTIHSISAMESLDADEKNLLFQSMADGYEKQGSQEDARIAAIHLEYWRFQESIDDWIAAMRDLQTVEGNVAAAHVNVFGRDGWNAFSPFVGPIIFSSAYNEFGAKFPYAAPYLLKLKVTNDAISNVIEAARQDADVLRTIAPMCNLPWQTVCDAESMYQALDALDPHNVANWVAVAPHVFAGQHEDDALGLPLDSVIGQFDRSKLHWKGVDARIFSSILSSLNEVAPQFVRDQRTSPSEVAKFIALTQFSSLIRHDEIELRSRCSADAPESMSKISREHCDVLLPALDLGTPRRMNLEGRIASDRLEAVRLFWHVGRYERSDQLVEDAVKFGYEAATLKSLERYRSQGASGSQPEQVPSSK